MRRNPNLIIVFDTETTGFSPEKNEVVQLSYILYDIKKQEVVYATKPGDDIVNIQGYIPKVTSDIHGITKSMTIGKRPIREHIDEFIKYCNQADRFVGHNIKFDIKMITGQMMKVIEEFPETEHEYRKFLKRFSMVGNDLPELAYCTMVESREVCARALKTHTLKYKKLMEVHKLLFKQDVTGQLHNALVDISVTLRVYLKLTMNLDICKGLTDFSSTVDNVTDNNTICSLIKPVQTVKSAENINYTGELITAYNVMPTKVQEVKVMVHSTAKKFVDEITKKAISKIVPEETTCATNIMICTAIIKSGVRSGETCGRPLKANAEYCHYHKSYKPAETVVEPVKHSKHNKSVIPYEHIETVVEPIETVVEPVVEPVEQVSNKMEIINEKPLSIGDVEPLLNKPQNIERESEIPASNDIPKPNEIKFRQTPIRYMSNMMSNLFGRFTKKNKVSAGGKRKYNVRGKTKRNYNRKSKKNYNRN